MAMSGTTAARRKRLTTISGLAAALVVVVLSATLVSAVTTNPALPLVDVPFLATPGLPKDSTLYLTTSSTCSTSTPIVTGCTIGGTAASNSYNSTTCLFTVTRASLGLSEYNRTAPKLYWCSSSFGTTPLGVFSIYLMDATPPFIFYGKETTITFGPAAPVGSVVGFYTAIDCQNRIEGTRSVALGPSRQVDLTIAPLALFLVTVCATVPTVTGGTTNILATTIVASLPYDITATEGLRHTSVRVKLGFTPQYVSLSKSPMCLTLAQAPVAVGDPTAVLPITVPQGTYYFCAVVSFSTGVYVPASSMFVVKEYGVQPHAMYTGLPTTITLTRSAIESGVRYEAGLFSNPDCTTAVLPWSADLTWTAVRAGTFYACVRAAENRSSTTALASSIAVSNVPSVTFSRSPGVMGLAVSAALTRNGAVGNISVGIAREGTACRTLLANASTVSPASNTVDLYIPQGAPAQVLYCVSTPTREAAVGEEVDAPFFYSMGSYSLRTYHLSFDPLLTGMQLAIGLDPEVQFTPGSRMKLVPSSSSQCGANPASGNPNTFQLVPATTQLTPVRFSTAGQWLLCVSEPSLLSGAYVLLRTLDVYGNATVKPNGLVTGVAWPLTITGVPPSSTVYFTTEAICRADGSNSKVFSATSNSFGEATVSGASYPLEGTLSICVGYRGEDGGIATNAVMRGAGSIRVAPPQAFPSVAISGQPTVVRLQVPDVALLVGGLAYLLAGSTATCSATSVPSQAPYQLPIVADQTDGAMPSFIFTPAASAAGTAFTVCVGSMNSFVSAGTVRVFGPMTMTSTPASVPRGMPMSATFSGAAFDALQPDTFAVIDAAVNCTSDLRRTTVYARGNISATGRTDVFLAPSADTVRAIAVCVRARTGIAGHTTTYAMGGQIALYPFTAVSTLAVIGAPNHLQGWPETPYAALALVRCSGTACSATRATATCQDAKESFYTSEEQPLSTSARPGTYVLCQRSTVEGLTSAVVGSNTTVEVGPAWTMTTTADPIRQFQPFTVTLRGGPSSIPQGTPINVRVQPASVRCSTVAAESETFTLNNGQASSLTITRVSPMQDVVFCLLPTRVDAFAVMTAALRFYMTPATLIANVATTVRSAMVSGSALAKISSSDACADIVSTGGPQPITDYTSKLTVAGCGANKALHTVFYCESTNGGASYMSRGPMGLLRRTGCPDDPGAASIVARTSAPGTAITDYGINTPMLVNPRLSRSSTCARETLLPADVSTKGYSPRVGEVALFYVCASPIDDPTIEFTTDVPTLTVVNWAVTPTAIVSRPSPTIGVLQSTRLTINYQTPSPQTFLSTSAQCGQALTPVAGLATSSKSATVSLTGVNGLTYVCAMDSLSPGSRIAVAVFLSVMPPAITRSTPAVIRDASYAVTLVVQGAAPIYSMQPGADKSYTYASYFISEDRAVFLSSDRCRTNLTGTTQTSVNSDNVATIVVPKSVDTSVTSVQLCTGTPAGVAIALGDVPVAPGELYPYRFTAGSRATIYIPHSPNTRFTPSYGSGDCSGAATTALPSFTTDASGYGEIVLYSSDGTAAATGAYSLCYSDGAGAPLRPLATSIDVVVALHFDIRGLMYFVGVRSTMVLLQDLEFQYLLPGFSTSRDCVATDESVGTWEPLEGRTDSIAVTARSSASRQVFLCARSPSNNSLVSLPSGGASISFAAAPISMPAGDAMDTCNPYTFDSCYAPGPDAPSDAVLGVIHGDCCSPTDQASNVVGRTGMGGGSCSLTLDHTAARKFGVYSIFSVCVWSPRESGYCATLGRVNVTTSCRANTKGGGTRALTGGKLAAVIIFSILGGLLLLALILYLIYRCCCGLGDSSGYVDIDRGLPKGTQLVPLRHMEMSKCDQRVYARRHPLLFYPREDGDLSRTTSPSQVATRSQSQPAMLDSRSDPLSLLDLRQADARDQIMLTEARERYAAQLAFKDAAEDIALMAKEYEVEVGFEFDDVGSALVGHASPELRQVEEIETETHECVDVDVDCNSDETVNTAHRRLRSCSIESSRPSTPRRKESFMRDKDEGNRDEENGQNRDRVQRGPPAHFADAFAIPVRGSVRSPQAVGDAAPEPDTPPARSLIVRSLVSRPSRGRVNAHSAAPPGSRPAATGAANAEGTRGNTDDDDDDDALNYTTTQRYHDEVRFLLENEGSRRQRLCNWEEEERAPLVQQGMDERAKVSQRQQKGAIGGEGQAVRPAGSQGSFRPSVMSEADAEQQRRENSTASATRRATDQSDHMSFSGIPFVTDERVMKSEYTAPEVPAALPALPPAPRSAAVRQRDLGNSTPGSRRVTSSEHRASQPGFGANPAPGRVQSDSANSHSSLGRSDLRRPHGDSNRQRPVGAEAQVSGGSKNIPSTAGVRRGNESQESPVEEVFDEYNF